MSKIENKIIELIAEKNFSENLKIKDYENANSYFNTLIEKGMTQKRGNTLKTNSEYEIAKLKYNANNIRLND
jgi:hypothetical protein